MMRVIDLTHTISADMPVYPGTEPPQLLPGSSYEADGFRETILHMYSHTGTHMDAPNHLFAGRSTLEGLPAAQFAGQALVVDCQAAGAGARIGMDYLAPVLEEARTAEFLLFQTGWSQHWGEEAYFGDYPCLDFDVIRFLIETKKKGVGLDTIGIDPIADTALTRHRMLFERHDTVVIENLCGLAPLVGAGPFLFAALPLKFAQSDGAPVRAVAFLA